MKKSIIRKIAYYQTLFSLFTFSDEHVETTEKPKDFERNPDHDDDDDDNDDQVDKVAHFNDDLTMALIRSTQGEFHHCAEVVDVTSNNRSVGRRQKRFVWFFGVAIALVICK